MSTLYVHPRRLYNSGTIESTPISLSVTGVTTVAELAQWLNSYCDPDASVEIECDHDEDSPDKYLDIMRQVNP